ncbi:MAG: tyrosine-type recombinase/integrase, partial [Bacteroidia bacterium]|nr:tyrosine-type recombinase/integrase [Bacteroidia bacterium]
MFFKEKKTEDISNNDVITFHTNYIIKKRLSSSFQNQIINAIKLFFKTIENRELEISIIVRPRREKTLPNVLSKEEIKLIIESIINIKHRAMISLLYACGLRRSELINLEFNHIDTHRKVLLIKQSKGKKDRIVPISEKVINMLREYYKLYKPKTYLF